jgi:hypothetical protein
MNIGKKAAPILSPWCMFFLFMNNLGAYLPEQGGLRLVYDP